MAKKPWTDERRWNSLIKAGAVDADGPAGDIAYVAERLQYALYPTMWESVRAQAVRSLCDHALDLMNRHISERRAPLDERTRMVIERLLYDMLRSSGRITGPKVRAFCASAAVLLPDSAEVLLAEADMMLGEGRHEEAEQLLTRVLQAEPRNERAILLARVAKLDPERRG